MIGLGGIVLLYEFVVHLGLGFLPGGNGILKSGKLSQAIGFSLETYCCPPATALLTPINPGYSAGVVFCQPFRPNPIHRRSLNKSSILQDLTRGKLLLEAPAALNCS